jgi:sugar lactone lactonase YvrE
MAFDSYPGDDTVLDLTPGQESDELPIMPVRFGPDMFLRVVRLAAGAAAPPPKVGLRANTGDIVEVVPDSPTLTDLPGSTGGAVVATADLKVEPNDVYRVRIFPQDPNNPPTKLALQLTNLDTRSRAFRWVVADNLSETVQPRVVLPPTRLNARAERPETGEIEVRNIGTGPLRVEAVAGTDLGAGFELTTAPVPMPVPVNGVARMKISFTSRRLPAGTDAVVETSHRFTTDDPIAQRPERRDARVTIIADVLGPRWQPGDVLVVDPQGSDGSAGRVLIRVDPATGRQTVVCAGNPFVSPAGVALAPDGHALVADAGAVDGNGAVIRVDRFTGARIVLSSGNLFRDPSAVVVTPQGRIVVTDPNALGTGALITVDPQNGAQVALSSGAGVSRAFNLAVDDPATGSLVALCRNVDGRNRVVRVDPTGGTAEVTTDRVDGIAVDETRRVLLTLRPDGSGPKTLVAHRPNGTRDVLSTGLLLGEPLRLRRDRAGHVWVVDQKVGGASFGLIRIRLSDGEQTLMSSGGVLRFPLDLVVVPPIAT